MLFNPHEHKSLASLAAINASANTAPVARSPPDLEDVSPVLIEHFLRLHLWLFSYVSPVSAMKISWDRLA
jgi:hypothetical protein